MKIKSIFLVVSLILNLSLFSQDNIVSCCSMEQSIAFADLADDDNFVGSHELPRPYVHLSEVGNMITYPVADGENANAFVLKREGSNKWLFVIHEWWGLNDHIKREAEQLFNDLGDVNVIAIDMYDGKVATTREDAGNYMKSVKGERANAIINGAFKYAGENAKIASIGWCFGGGWSLQTSILAENSGVGCVIYYGMPEEDTTRLKMLNGPVLGIFANQDNWINGEVVDKFQKNMEAANKNLTVQAYDADHAFANPSSERYNGEAAKNAYNKTLEFLKKIYKS